MTAAALVGAAGSTSEHKLGAAYSPPSPYPQDAVQPFKRHLIPDDKVIWFQLAVPSMQLIRLVLHYAERRL